MSRVKTAAKTGLVQPHTYITGCSTSAFELYDSPGWGGNTICFIGSGFVNLTDYCAHWFGNAYCTNSWNDNAASFWSGCSTGTMYSDINGGGGSQRFDIYEKGNFSYGNIQNYSLSSLKLDSNCTN
ncbi:hypothetical protein [Dictyobacter halimunensis]|uniref:hypothetical protein n=1 Tax=Dictyobacter halimunensis TaxID=3026934 RepID=UPI0030C6F5C0